ncbi:hypothetical protein ABTM66_19500, partial [Acinetobacter baumannii]
LIIGSRNTFSGSLQEEGFINRLKTQAQLFLKSITFYTLEWPVCGLPNLLEDRERLILLKEMKATKIFFFFENEPLKCIDTNEKDL